MNNDWYEKGELPPEKTYCQVNINGKWSDCFLIGRDDFGGFVYRVGSDYGCVIDKSRFRPPQTEADKLIEQAREDFIKANVGSYTTYERKCIEALIDAGWRPVKQQGEV